MNLEIFMFSRTFISILYIPRIRYIVSVEAIFFKFTKVKRFKGKKAHARLDLTTTLPEVGRRIVWVQNPSKKMLLLGGRPNADMMLLYVSVSSDSVT